MHIYLSEIYRNFLRKILKIKKILLDSSSTAKLSYAGGVPSASKVSFGGRVKLSFLNDVYPEQKKIFNILYVVSSALSVYAQEWFRICKKAGIKIVWNQNGVGYPAWAGKKYQYINKPMSELIHQADWVIYQSQFCKVSADRYLGKFKGPQAVIYNCVDTNIFKPPKTCLFPSPIRLLIMGSHEQADRVLKAIQTLAVLGKRNIDSTLTIAGRLAWPGARKQVREAINSMDLNKNITVRGPYLQKDAAFLYQGAHILLHLKYADPCPSVVIESMACGVPVIGSKSGGMPELIGEEAGIALDVPQSWDLLHVPDSEIIADAIISIMNNWSHYSGQARKRAAKNFNKDIWISKHSDIFHKLTAKISSF